MSSHFVENLCSVVCTTYNHSKFCREALRSIFDQTYQNIEIIIIDDGSTDANVECIQASIYESPFPCKLITQENTGNVALNMNRALDHATGQFMTVLSLDDKLTSDCISTKIDILNSNPNTIFVANTCNPEIDENNKVVTPLYRLPIYNKNGINARDLIEFEYEYIGSFYTQSTVFRRSVIEAVNRYDEDLTGDDLIIRTKILQFMRHHSEMTFELLDYPGFLYRKHSDNLHRNTLRQLNTVYDWHKRFFSDRPYPKMFTSWAENYFIECQRNNRPDQLKATLDKLPEIKLIYLQYKRTWAFWRRTIDYFIRRKLGLAHRTRAR